MFMSIVNDVVENQQAAMRSAGLVPFCSARGSEVDAAQVAVDCPAGTGVTYDGLLALSPMTLYPLLPYTDFQLPCVVVSILTNVALPGEDTATVFVRANVTGVRPGAAADTL